MLTYQPKITFGDVRAFCVRDVLVYCRDRKCSHHIAINADAGRIMSAFRGCGHRGADVRPLFELARMGTAAQRNGPSVGASWGRRLGGLKCRAQFK